MIQPFTLYNASLTTLGAVSYAVLALHRAYYLPLRLQMSGYLLIYLFQETWLCFFLEFKIELAVTLETVIRNFECWQAHFLRTNEACLNLPCHQNLHFSQC
ncbi:hypothetical protein OUZ56_031205 [Daphnia magna]|uniref:Uncharacterized protein n=1 Tax=Daphnia magna TaxID=35525 RepID=A0ABQ9ZU35_9CRUS|nr:hypothetical protein OUZ56_031205 [Daphnia magna]